MYVTYGKDYYHLQNEMSQWCVKHFGEGKWIGDRYPRDWTGLPRWTIHCMFGHTTFAFKQRKDYHWFLLKWGS
jgi:hypothetical protein